MRTGRSKEAPEAERQREALETPETPGCRGAHDEQRRHGDAGDSRNAEISECQTDSDELRHDREAVEEEQIDDAKRSPKAAETLEDEARMTNAGDDAET